MDKVKDQDSSTKTSGQANFSARARLLIHLGNQLITDEVAAISELIKNSYDADAKKVIVELHDVSKESGWVTITDNGNGMTLDTILESWLELGSISKAHKQEEPPRVSEFLKRTYLGEKGLGRLSVHKIGNVTEIVTRRRNTDSEVTLAVNWKLFEDKTKFLGDVKTDWIEDKPSVFLGKPLDPKKTQDDEQPENFANGTRITMKSLQRVWTKETIEQIRYFVETLNSPLSSVTDFKVMLQVDDPEDTKIAQTKDKMKGIFDTAHYTFSSDVSENGTGTIKFSYKSKLYPQFNTEKNIQSFDLRQSKKFKESRKPNCGSFKFYIYCWDLDPKDRESTFDESIQYETMVKPLTGIKLFRDNFRVLPYGNVDNDWLNMDKSRIGSFADKVSRGQVIGYAEISANKNPQLIDKSDREGLIDNDAFRDFHELVVSCLAQFEAERWAIRAQIKDVKKLDMRLKQLTKHMTSVDQLLQQENVKPEIRTQITEILEKTNKLFKQILDDSESSLLVAASLGLTYMIPTHEAHRNVQESEKIISNIIHKSEPNVITKLKLVAEYLNQSDEILSGVVTISQKIKEQQNFQLKNSADTAINLMRPKFKHENIEIITDYRNNKTITGAQRLISICLLNMLDNSVYWLNTNKNTDKKIKVIVTNFDKYHALIVSDNGPGFIDSIEFVTMPFITRKTKGMGLGLYICKRIAQMHNATLEILSEDTVPGLLPGANIAILFPIDG